MRSYPWNSRASWPGTAIFLSPPPGLIEKLPIHLGPDRLSTGNFLALSIALANVITAVLAVGYTQYR